MNLEVENALPVQDEIDNEKAKTEEMKKENIGDDSFAFDVDRCENLLLNYFKGLDSLFSSYKKKDANLLSLSKELADYRTGLKKTLFKSLSTYFISYRESIVKQRDDLDNFDYDLDTLKEYFSLFEDNLEGLLLDINLVDNGNGSLLYNGKDINLNTELNKELEITLPIDEKEEFTKPEFHCMDDVEKYLSDMNEKMIRILKNKEIVDQLLDNAIALNSSVKRQETQVILYPVLRKVAKMKDSLRERILRIKDLEDEDAYLAEFKKNLKEMLDEMDDILLSCGITLDSIPEIGSEYDPKTMQSLGFIQIQEKEDLHGKVAASYSPAYFFEGNVLKKAKIKLYRFVK